MKRAFLIFMISLGLVFSGVSLALSWPAGGGNDGGYDDSVAIGTAAVTEADNAVAIGHGAVAEEENSVAIGAGSVADEEDTVSVGDEGSERRITNVANGIFRTDAVNVGQLRNVNGELNGLETEIDNLEDRMDTAESDIDNLEGRMDQAEGDIDGLQEDVTELQGDVDNLEGRMDEAESDIDDLDGRVTENEGDIENLDERVTINEGDIVNLDNRVTVNETNIEELQAKDMGFDWTAGGETPVGASANGLGSTAVGDGAVANAYDTAVGYNANVAADGSVAVGANATVASGATNSVALGQNSVASEANTVSVGSAGNQRRITNIANGINDSDAVNMYQLNSTAAAFQSQFDQMDSRMDNMDDRIDDVGAMSAAFSALVPNPRVTQNTHFSLGVGAYEGNSAAAAGLFHFIDDCTFVNVGVSHGFRDGETAGRAGISIGW
jgi:autotransporter adhesin